MDVFEAAALAEKAQRGQAMVIFEGKGGDDTVYFAIDFESPDRHRCTERWCSVAIVAYRIVGTAEIRVVHTAVVNRPISGWCPGARKFWDEHPEQRDALIARCGENDDAQLKQQGNEDLAAAYAEVCLLAGGDDVVVVTDMRMYDGVMFSHAMEKAGAISPLYSRDEKWKGSNAFLDTGEMKRALDFAGVAGVAAGVAAIKKAQHTHHPLDDARGIAYTHAWLHSVAEKRLGFGE